MKNLAYILIGAMSMMLLSFTPAYQLVISKPQPPKYTLVKCLENASGDEITKFIQNQTKKGFVVKTIYHADYYFESTIVIMEKY